MDQLADVFRALGEKGRLKIIEILTGGEKCVCELIEEIDLSQAAISHHLMVLRKAGLIKVRREGRWGFYSLDKEGLEKLEVFLEKEIFRPAMESPEGGGRQRPVCSEK